MTRENVEPPYSLCLRLPAHLCLQIGGGPQRADLPNGGDTKWMNNERDYDLAITVSEPGSSKGMVQSVSFILKASTDLNETFLVGSYW